MPMLMYSQPQPEEQMPDIRELLNYEEAAEYLKLSRGRIGGLVMEGTLHAVKLPNTRFKYLRRKELDWYDGRRKGKNEPNPVRSTSPAPQTPVPPLDTLATLRQYVEQHMAGSEEASQLDTLLAKVAGHVAVTLALSKSIPLPEDERAQLAALLGALT
jgi:hypothetical protein